MGSSFFKDVTASVQLAGGNTGGNASVVIPVPYRAGVILGIVADIKTGTPDNFGMDFFSRKNGSNFFTTEANLYRLKTVATAARTEYHELDAYFAYAAEAGGSSTGGERLGIAVNIGFTGAVANSLVEFDVRVIGIGLN